MCLFPSPFARALKAAESQRMFFVSSTSLIYQTWQRNRRKSSRKANVSENRITSAGRKNKSGQSGWVNPRANEVKQIMKVDDSKAFNEEAFKKLSHSDRWFDVDRDLWPMIRGGLGFGATTVMAYHDNRSGWVSIYKQRKLIFIEIYERFSDLWVEKVAVQSEEGWKLLFCG